MKKVEVLNPEATEKVWGRLLSTADLMAYTGLGRNGAIAFGEKSGAKRKIGKRSLYDRKRIDAYIDELPAAETEGTEDQKRMKELAEKKIAGTKAGE